MGPLRMIAVLAVSVVATVLAVGLNPGNSISRNGGDGVAEIADSTIVGSSSRKNSAIKLPVELGGGGNRSSQLPEERVRVVRRNSTEVRIGSRLGLRKHASDPQKGKRTVRNTMTGRQFFFGQTFPVSGEFSRDLYVSGQDKMFRGAAKSYKSNHYDYPGDERYYNDYGYAPNEEDILRMSEVSLPEERLARFNPGYTPDLEKSSCRKYLEFLKYAFEQLDKEERSVDYYHPSHGRRSENPAPVIVPNMDLLRRMAVGGASADFEMKEDVDQQYVTESISKLVSTERMPQATVSPVEDKSSGKGKSRHIEDTSSSTENTTTVGSAGVPVYRVGLPVQETTMKPEEVDAVEGECHNKFFPCPDNLNVTYPVNGYCNRFVVCESGKPRPEFCQEGLHFNLVTRQCDLPHNSFCTYSCPRANGYFGVPGDCSGFFRCLNWYPEYRMCPPRMHWDVSAKICVFKELSACPLKCESPYQVKGYGGVCSSYVICSQGEPTFYRCPSGAHFDRDLLRCVPQVQSSCTESEDYIVRNRGLENGRKTLCAKVELKESISKWCQQTSEGYK